ncbi:hypothetical protein J3R83DRAFT_12914 [Lanmaoa asiatica]|nr:hypothetical protein J3R83DRAFT_12914 [Lanmaoa asiatica]
MSEYQVDSCHTGRRQLNSLLRLIKPATLREVSVGRYNSTKTRRNRRTTENDGGDFRPPWVYSGSRFLTYTTIPREAIPIPSATALTQSLVTLLYCSLPRRLGRARTHLYAPLANQHHAFTSCADGYQSINNRFSPYLRRKLRLFKETMDRRPPAPSSHPRRRVHNTMYRRRTDII